jgi:hypothetical protein
VCCPARAVALELAVRLLGLGLLAGNELAFGQNQAVLRNVDLQRFEPLLRGLPAETPPHREPRPARSSGRACRAQREGSRTQAPQRARCSSAIARELVRSRVQRSSRGSHQPGDRGSGADRNQRRTERGVSDLYEGAFEKGSQVVAPARDREQPETEPGANED